MERGVSLTEVLVSISILAIVGLNITLSTISGLKIQKRSLRNMLAHDLAIQQLESYTGRDPSTLSDSDDLVEQVFLQNIAFQRATDITVNSDNSRTISVTVNGSEASLGGKARFETTVSLWGEQ